MPVFISYSRRDREFVDRLAAHLVENRVWIWLDRWELNVGDSLLERIQQALSGASALIVVLSTAAVESAWFKKELSAGLVRELEEGRVLVLPVLIEDCSVPIFLREKLYADFRTNYDEGFRTVMEAVAKITSDSLGRIEEPQFHVDWGIDSGYSDEGLFRMEITMVEQGQGLPYCALTQVSITANEAASLRQQQYDALGLDWFGQSVLLDAVAEELGRKRNLRVILSDQRAKQQNIMLTDHKSPRAFAVTVTARRLGQDTGKDILLRTGAQLEGICETVKQAGRKLTPEETAAVGKLIFGGA